MTIEQTIANEVLKALEPRLKPIEEFIKQQCEIRCYTLPQAAKLTGINAQTIRRECINGNIKHKRTGGRYHISHAALYEYINKQNS